MAHRRATTPRSHCPISFALDQVGDRWTLLVLRDLVIVRKRTFRELSESPEGIASNILTARLRSLEDAGFIVRTPDPESARRVLYEPTAKALDLLPVMLELVRWGARHDPQTAAPAEFVRRIERDCAAVAEEIRAAHRKPRSR